MNSPEDEIWKIFFEEDFLENMVMNGPDQDFLRNHSDEWIQRGVPDKHRDEWI